MRKRIQPKPTTRLANIIYSHWRGAISRVAEQLGISPSGVYRAMEKDIKTTERQEDYTSALNHAFWTQYEAKDLFI